MKDTKEFIVESKKYGNFTVLIDAEDWEIVSARKWHIKKNIRCKSRDVFYIQTALKKSERIHWGYPEDLKKNKLPGRHISMHRFLLRTPRGMITDHINRDTLDNRKENLRICTQKENNRNRSPSKYRYRGVRYHPNRNKAKQDAKPWESVLQRDGKNIHLGRHCCEELAAIAHDEHVLQIKDPFTSLNFPSGIPEDVKKIIDTAKKEAEKIEKEWREKKSSKYIGVSYRKGSRRKDGTYNVLPNPWTATISIKNRTTVIGLYETEEEAATSRDKKVKELLAVYPDTPATNWRLNFPEEHDDVLS